MKIIDLLRMSGGSLFKRKFRTILTVLGVVIGTTSIIVMLSLGIGMKSAMLEEMESYASLTTIEIYQPNRWGSSSGSDTEELFLDDNLVEMLQGMEHVTMVSPQLETSAILRMGNYESNIWIYGISPEAMERMAIPLAQGSYPKPGEQLSFIYGNMVIQDFRNVKTGTYEYWENGTLPPIDLYNDPAYVIFDRDRYWMAGSLDENGQIIPQPKKYIIEAAGIVEGSVDEWNSYSYNVYCDIDALKTQLQQVFKGRAIPGQPTMQSGKPYKEIFYSTINVEVDEMDNVADVQSQINMLGYETYAASEWISSEMDQMNVIQAVLGGIGAVSLFVAAIGITNTMMMSIYERTKEIGIMKVIGCRIRDIQTLFLMEAGFIGFIGGIVGVGLSYGLSVVINNLVAQSDFGIEQISRIPLWLSLLSIVFAIGIGMLSGLFPSIRAMRLSPLAAIRSE
ncbi:MAG: ABC transporter permease [Lachnospiraceae bacterium]|nr:ABC transporter permease [Lachnospiraceae bacterium]